jgi:L-ribulokinase
MFISWNGLPDKEFLESLSKGWVLCAKDCIINRSARTSCWYLSKEWADKLGLSTDVAVAVGAFDAHMGAVGAVFPNVH